MTIYELLLFVHIMAAIVWVGGAVASQITAVRVMKAGDAARKATLAGELEWMGTRVFTPASGILFLFGIFLVLNGNWSWGEPWIGGGITIWLVSTVLGIAFFGPELGRIQKLTDAEGADSPAVMTRVDRLLLVSRVELGLLILAVFLMSTKPGTNF
jgi:uncharacterized membrane protein